MKKITTITVLFLFVSCLVWVGCQKEEEDLIPPAEVANLVATIGEGQVELNWAAPKDSDLKEFVITRDPIGKVTFLDKVVTKLLITGLEGDVEHTFFVKTKDVAGNLSEGASVKATPVPIDVLAPGEVTNLLADAGDGQVELTWTNPTDADFKEIILSYEPGGGNQVIANTETSVIITGLTNDTEYVFTLKTVDQKGNTSNGAETVALPNNKDTNPPADVTGLSLLGYWSEEKIEFNWGDPNDPDFKEVVLLYGDQEISIDKGLEAYDLSLAPTGVQYTFTLKTRDETGNLSSGVSVTVIHGNYTLDQDAIDNIDPKLTMILTGKLKIPGNVSNLSKLGKINHVGGKLQIYGNADLTTLSGLEGLNYVGGKIYIGDNPKLSEFCALKNLFKNGTHGSVTIEKNQQNPTVDEIKACE